MKKFINTCLLSGILILSQSILSQDLGVISDNTMIAVPSSGNSSSGNLNFTTPCSEFKVNEGKVWVKFDLGEQYQFGSGVAGIPFDITINLDLIINTSGVDEPTINFNVNLNNQQPEGLVYLDLRQYLDDENNTTGLSYLNETVTGVKATINSVIDINGVIDLQTNINISLNHELKYGINVDNNVVTLISNLQPAGSKVMSFAWDDSCAAPNYEFQLLRLYNKDPLILEDEKSIISNIDWSKALSFQTYNSENQISITIGEGQGFYIWRVRPIGTFFENGAGNAENWGAWNSSIYNSDSYNFNVPTANNEVFFFEDPDDDTNYQYSRVFTEGNKVSEQATYATTLNQVRQTQRYFPSKDYKIISQTVLDNSGRPTLTTLPVPVEGKKINQYKNNFVTTNGELYRAKHFDNIENFNQPLPAVIDATGAYSYYTNANPDKRIPNAEGYPYTRVLFSNDGTDRVVEQSGVGKTHAIGSQESGQGRTVRTIYGTPTEEELVSLFGDEAPLVENTAKVITIDPNNTKSVAYITKEGNTIATGLTFSEDEAVLDKIATGPTVSGKMDKITNNTATSNGFKASKRITVLQENTEMNIAYAISISKIEGLCNNLEIEMDYDLVIQIFDVETSEIVTELKRESIRQYLANPNEEEITIDFGSVFLNTGTYYIQKTLIPSDDVTAKLVVSQQTSKNLIQPFFEWLVNVLDEIDCEEEMQYLYNDLFFYGKTIHQNQLLSNLDTEDKLQFNCADCSGIEYQFKRKDPNDLDAADEFLDFYELNAQGYDLSIWYRNTLGELIEVDFSQTSLGSIKPVEVSFNTPCCEFNIPIIYTPSFNKPSPEALVAYVDNGNAVGTSTDYYNINLLNENTQSTSSQLVPNYNFLTNDAANFKYSGTANNITIDNGNAYPLDFEGYAISMLNECRSGSINPETGLAYTMTDAQNDIYNAMRGWHRPGLLNQMIYHMATDDYGQFGCANHSDGSDDGSTTLNSEVNSPDFENKYQICDVPDTPVKLPGAQYSVNELVECWEPLVIELVNRLCGDGFETEITGDSNVSNNVILQEDGAEKFDKQFDDGIKSWILRWISRGKIKRKLKRQRAGSTEDIKDEVEKLSGNLVKTFLECTGYAFADIIDPNFPIDPSDPKVGYEDLASDFNTAIPGYYNPARLVDGNNGTDWQYFAIDPNDPLANDGYISPPADPAIETTGILKDIMPNLQDPVYAFKYFTYEAGTFPSLEVETCYRDPNICYDANGNEIPCCVDASGNEIPCNFCGVGYITCPYTKNSWSCNQRYTFYEMIKNFQENTAPDGIVVDCSNYYEATVYFDNPDYGIAYEYLPDGTDNSNEFVLRFNNQFDPANPTDGGVFLDAFIDYPYLSQQLIDNYVSNPSVISNTPVQLTDINGVAGSGISIIENDAYAMQEECSTNCEDRRSEFREELIKVFVDRCYEIGECKITPNDNIIPEADIELMVDQLVLQCQSQCTITTYTCVDEPCRNPTKSPYDFGNSPEESNDFNTSYIDYGVSGPVVFSVRNENIMAYDGGSGSVIQGEGPTVDQIDPVRDFYKYSYSSNPSIWDVRRSLTYAEYSRWIQAMEWDIVLDVPAKCDDDGFYNPNLTYDSGGLLSPNTQPVYYYNEEGIMVQQNTIYDENGDVVETNPFSVAPSPYVTRSNDTGPGDTFVERDQYIKTSTTPMSPNDPSLREPVVSPEIGIKVEVNNN